MSYDEMELDMIGDQRTAMFVIISDTDVIFTDIETGETYTVGYITSGVSEKIQLQKGKWYTVEGAGNITVSPVNIRIE